MACCQGPGYATPKDAYTKSEPEKLLYVIAVSPNQSSTPDYLATVDVDPASATYSQVISRLKVPNTGDELHHFGWNACSSCHSDSSKKRDKLVIPGFKSGRVYIVDVGSNARAPKLYKTIEPAELAKGGVLYPHTSHCLGSSEIMISCLGDEAGEGKGAFVLLDEDFNVKGPWSVDTVAYGYDFWYQPRHNIMVSTGIGAPNSFFKGFNPAEVPTRYGSKLYLWDWAEKRLRKEIELGEEGLIPLEVRFAHDPDAAYGFVGCGLSSNIVLVYKGEDGEWTTKVVIKQEWADVEGWALPQMPPMVTDILISLNDKFLFFSNWLRGDISQYDITDPHNPVLVDRFFIGGSAIKGGAVTVKGKFPEGYEQGPEALVVKGVRVQGGPQMLQLSRDGRRLYVTNSLLSPWDHQFYPEMTAKGSQLLKIDTDPEQGGLRLDPEFLVDFGAEPDGPYLAHEARIPGGDCSSDVWV